MKLYFCFGLSVASLILLSSDAEALVTDCTGVTNDVGCVPTGQCVLTGKCQDETCVPTAYRSDGTGCATGNACTNGDHCEGGLCVAGTPVNCPGDACHIATCDPLSGCGAIEIACDGGTDMLADMTREDATAPTATDTEEISPIGLGLGAGPSHSSCSFTPGSADSPLAVFLLLVGLLAISIRRFAHGQRKFGH